ncbi:phage antirepressor KilAC domain-containing protein [Sphingobacterium spiritivorum]|nr:phage antirepressor KilAC domain-containing protein [Sphingobacterium spiritivorum]
MNTNVQKLNDVGQGNQHILQVFQNSKFGDVRTIISDDIPYFVANDVAKALGYKNPSDATNTHCKKSLMTWGSDSLGRRQEFKVIPEGDIYRLVIKSQLPGADEFESWIFDEVLPSIRKHGVYSKNQLDFTDPNTVLQLAQNWAKEREEKLLAYEQLEISETIREEQSKVIKLSVPKLKHYDEVLSSEGYMTINTIAEGLGFTHRKLNKILKDLKVQYLEGKVWKLYAKYKGKGYAKPIPFPYPASDGSTKTSHLLKWTEAGKEFIHDILKKNNIV